MQTRKSATCGCLIARHRELIVEMCAPCRAVWQPVHDRVNSERRLKRIAELAATDPAPESPEGKELLRLADVQHAYELLHLPNGETRDSSVRTPSAD
jgi:hypothetical protein